MAAEGLEFHVLEVENKLSLGAGGGVDYRNLEFTLELRHSIHPVGIHELHSDLMLRSFPRMQVYSDCHCHMGMSKRRISETEKGVEDAGHDELPIVRLSSIVRDQCRCDAQDASFRRVPH